VQVGYPQAKNLFKLFESLKNDVDDTILDGEFRLSRRHRISRFNQLLSKLPQPIFYVFDSLRLNGDDLRRLTLTEGEAAIGEIRKEDPARTTLIRSSHRHDGVRMFEEICNKDLEDIVAKRHRSYIRRLKDDAICSSDSTAE
jgi:ATP-dependent DNA ligase